MVNVIDAVSKTCIMMRYDALCICQSLSELRQSADSACQQFVTTSGSAVVQQRQRTRTKFAERAFSVDGPSVWNSLPADLRLEPDTAVIKRKLKSYLFPCFVLFYSVIFSVFNVILCCTLFYIVMKVH